MQYVLTFFEFIHHDNFEGAGITVLFLFLLSCLPGLTLDTTPRSLAHSQLGLDRTYTHTETLTKTKKLKAYIYEHYQVQYEIVSVDENAKT